MCMFKFHIFECDCLGLIDINALYGTNTTTFSILKAALINLFILIMDYMTMRNVEVVICCDKPTENYHQL